ncbi:hypothetical protein DSO57_1022997 [Entomophthora muscae]|uniref:Uncharacterized protein n=1 Tax=Entomophthora muscae TaxID=34485 RepID=A0ACC2U0W0_9FUNG|nr:hypothetical protein DSO57_1022997 [Entomophthora muscae]
MGAATFVDVKGALLNYECKQPKANVHHVGQKDSENNKPAEDNEEEDVEDSKKLLSSQVTEKTLTASSNNPSPTLDPDPAAKEPPDEEASMMYLDARPESSLPYKEEVNKDLLH